MDDVEKLQQMNDVERIREIMDLISNNMHKQNDKDRMEMLAMLASTTAMETNLMSGNFARRADTQATGKKTKKKAKALMKGVEQADNGKDKAASSTQSNSQSPQKQQQPNQPQQAPANTLATRTQQAIDKKKKMARKVTTGTIKPFSTI